MAKLPPGEPTPLTMREAEVMKLAGDGLTTRQIAERLGLRPCTVYTYRASVCRKLHVRSITRLFPPT